MMVSVARVANQSPFYQGQSTLRLIHLGEAEVHYHHSTPLTLRDYSSYFTEKNYVNVS